MANDEIKTASDRGKPNFTIIVNWKERGFGCNKACSYCNWRSSPLLPQGAQSQDTVTAFIRQCKKSFITISGGGDPLYKFDENFPALLAMVDNINANGYRVRIITREIQHVAKLKGIADHISISLDDDVLDALPKYQNHWKELDVEYSLVLPPLPIEALIDLKPQYMALHRQLGRRLVLRENFNSIFPLDLQVLSFGHSGIVYVPKSLCLNSRYLSTIDCIGHDIVQDNAALIEYIMIQPGAHVFGGLVKHLLDPAVHLEYSDIDVIATSMEVMDELAEKFAFTFKEVSTERNYPRYFIGKSIRAGKDIQVVLMDSASDAKKFIFNAQYAVDRVGYNNGFFFDPLIGESAIRQAALEKSAVPVSGPRNTELFHADRQQIELRHKSKLIKKGFFIATV
jgi:hypothetical protein